MYHNFVATRIARKITQRNLVNTLQQTVSFCSVVVVVVLMMQLLREEEVSSTFDNATSNGATRNISNGAH